MNTGSGHLQWKCAECGTSVRYGRIVNGNASRPGSYPWTVGIQYGEKLYCGGSLITSWFVITAAHCVKAADNCYVGQTRAFIKI